MNNPNYLTEEQLEILAEKSEGYTRDSFRFSGSDISVLVRDAMFEPLRFSPVFQPQALISDFFCC